MWCPVWCLAYFSGFTWTVPHSLAQIIIKTWSDNGHHQTHDKKMPGAIYWTSKKAVRFLMRIEIGILGLIVYNIRWYYFRDCKTNRLEFWKFSIVFFLIQQKISYNSTWRNWQIFKKAKIFKKYHTYRVLNCRPLQYISLEKTMEKKKEIFCKYYQKLHNGFQTTTHCENFLLFF